MTIQNPILAKAERELERSVPRAHREDYYRFVCAGMRLAMADWDRGLWAHLKSSTSPLQDCAALALDIAESVLSDPEQSEAGDIFRAGTMELLIETLDFAHGANILQVGPHELERARAVLQELIALRDAEIIEAVTWTVASQCSPELFGLEIFQMPNGGH